jgi:hypothetical protein
MSLLAARLGVAAARAASLTDALVVMRTRPAPPLLRLSVFGVGTLSPRLFSRRTRGLTDIATVARRYQLHLALCDEHGYSAHIEGPLRVVS